MRPKSRIPLALSLLASCAFSPALHAATFNVATPAEFQAALTSAAGNGENDLIQVAAGTYNLTTTLTYSQVEASGSSLSIVGANAATTILDGQNSLQIMSIESRGSVDISELTFQRGDASAAGDHGGGLELRVQAGDINVSSCRFLGNRSQDDGGGLYARTTNNESGNVEISNVIFENNRALAAGSDGGGAHLAAPTSRRVSVRESTFTANSAPDNGGGLQVEGLDPTDPLFREVGEALLVENVFRDNSTVLVGSGEGGGADLAASTIDIQSSQFYGNTGSSGGGLYLRAVGGPPNVTLTNSVFMGNQAASGSGGGLATNMIDLTAGFLRLVNNTVFGNSASVRGGGGFLQAMGSTSPPMSFSNNIFWGNTAPQAADLYVDNNPINDFTGPRVSLGANDTNGLEIKCRQPTCTVTETGTVNVDPRLVRTEERYDPHLQPTSPVIDLGAGTGLPETDFEGDPRVVGVAVDIGADEFLGETPPAVSADVLITMSDAPDPVLTGGRLTYSITVRNNGPNAAEGVVVTNDLPAGVSFVSAVPSQGTCAQAALTVTCTLGGLASSATATVTLTVDVTAASGTTLSNTASVSATTQDPAPNNNSQVVTTQVTDARADLSVAVTVSPNEPSVGETLTYTITVRNLGPDSDPAVTLDVVLPQLADLGSAVASQGTCSGTSGGLGCRLGTMPSGAQATVTIVMTGLEAGTLTLQVSVNGQLADASAGNNTASLQTLVTDVVELVVKGRGGLGGFGWLEFLGLVGLLLARRARRAATAVACAGCGLAAATLVWPAQAQASDAGWYVGASAGQASADYGSGDLATDLARRGWDILDPSVDDSDTFWKAYVGYQLNRHVALEAGYAALGEVHTRYRALVPPSQVDELLQDTFEVHPYLGAGWTASLVLRQVFAAETLAVYARAGIFVWEADIEVDVVSGGTGAVSGDESGTDGMFGFGVEWQFHPAWSLRAEWERYKLNEWADVPSAGICWRFR